MTLRFAPNLSLCAAGLGGPDHTAILAAVEAQAGVGTLTLE